jgi:peptide subunit release factor 1 (eRF1)
MQKRLKKESSVWGLFKMPKLSKIELEEVVKELESHKGKHTELISVYISAGYDANAVQKQLEAEKSTAKNIKSTATRKNVIDALDKIVRYLKTVRTPENGLAIFCGNISQVEGQQDLQLWNIEPPLPLRVRLYRCDKDFVIEPLKQMLEVEEVFGLLVMDRKEATIGLLEGKRIEVLQKMTSGIPSKVRAGGQCLGAEETVVVTRKGDKRINEVNTNEEIIAADMDNEEIIFSKCINKWMRKKKYRQIFLDDIWYIKASYDHTFFKKNQNGQIEEVIARDLSIGDELVLWHEKPEKRIYYKKISDVNDSNEEIEMVDIETEAGNFFANGILVHNSSQRYHRITEGLTKEFYKRIAEEMKRVFFEMPKLKGIIVGGPIPTKDEFLDGQYLVTKLQEKVIGKIDIGGSDESGLKELVTRADDILADQEITQEKKLLERFFETLGARPSLATLRKEDTEAALRRGAVETLFLSKDTDKGVALELKKLAENTGAKIEIISTETEEGIQFKNLGGIGAILRFKMS